MSFQLPAPSECEEMIKLKTCFYYSETKFSLTRIKRLKWFAHWCVSQWFTMMTSSNGNIFRVTGPLWGTKASDAELCCFLWSAPEKRSSKQSWRWWFDTPLCSLWRHCNDLKAHRAIIWTDHTEWRHNESHGISNHRLIDYLLNPLLRRASKETSKLRVTGVCEGNQRWPVDSPHKGPVTRKMFPFDDVIMNIALLFIGHLWTIGIWIKCNIFLQ